MLHRCDGDPRVRAQRGRLRGAGRAAGRRRVPAGRRPGGRRHRAGQHLRLRRAGQEGLRRRAARGRRPRETAGTAAAQAVVAVGCLAERYGAELADVAARGRRGARLRRLPRHRRAAALDRGGGDATTRTRPQDRRRLLPISPGDRAAAPVAPRARLDRSPMAPLKLASGCDRRCTFCAIPSFRGSFVSRRPTDVLDEARWLAADGVRELFLVSENSTSYGKDLGDLRLLETLLPELAGDRRRRAGPRLLPPARRDAARAARGDRDHARRRAVLRPLLPARQQRGAPPDAPVRRPRELPGAARPGPRRSPRRPASAPT